MEKHDIHTGTKIDVINIVIGIIVAYPMVRLFYVVVPDMKRFPIIMAGLIALAIGYFFKISAGVFYRRATLEEKPGSFWFNMGQGIGFVLFGLTA